VGGGILVGLTYAWVGRPAKPVTIAPEAIPEPAIDMPLSLALADGDGDTSASPAREPAASPRS